MRPTSSSIPGSSIGCLVGRGRARGGPGNSHDRGSSWTVQVRTDGDPGRAVMRHLRGLVAAFAVVVVVASVLPASAYQRPGLTGRVSVASNGGQTHESIANLQGGACAQGPQELYDMTPDGRLVAFMSAATDLVPND